MKDHERKKGKGDSPAKEFGTALCALGTGTVGHWRAAAEFPQQCTEKDQGFITRMAQIADDLGLDDDAELVPRLEALAAEVSGEKAFHCSLTTDGNNARVEIRIKQRASTRTAQPVATPFSCDIRRVPELIGALQRAVAAAEEEGGDFDDEISWDE